MTVKEVESKYKLSENYDTQNNIFKMYYLKIYNKFPQTASSIKFIQIQTILN